MGMFSKLSTAKPFTQSKYFVEGKFIVDILNTKFIDGYKGTSIVIEGKVLAVRDAKDDAVKAGDLCAHIWKLDGDKKDIGLATWMQFLGAVTNESPDQRPDSEWEELAEECFENNALEGEVMLLHVFDITTQKGHPFTKHSWQRLATDADKKEFGLS